MPQDRFDFREPWPALPLDRWRDTYQTLHRWMQVVGKIQLALTPLVNHWWNVAFSVTPRGLRTACLPNGDEVFEMEFDLLDHNLVVRTSRNQMRALALVPRPVADFFREVMAVLDALGLPVVIDDQPVEIASEVIRFRDDRLHASYDPLPVERLLRILQQSAAVFEEFRGRYVGKASPVQFFWGSFDLASSRYSGRRAPPRPEADAIARESYTHEVWNAGFWPGDARLPEPAYYAYAAPAPPGFADAPVSPAGARWHQGLGEFVLPYEAVRRAANPRETLLSFLQSTYAAAADLAHWDREALEAERGATAPPAAPETLH